MSPIYLMYQADNARQTLADLCELAMIAYARRVGCPATLLLVSPDAPDPLPDGARRSTKVRPGQVWAGEVAS